MKGLPAEGMEALEEEGGNVVRDAATIAEKQVNSKAPGTRPTRSAWVASGPGARKGPG